MKTNIKKFINFIKKIIYIILSFILNLFNKDTDNSGETKKSKQINKAKIKNENKENFQSNIDDRKFSTIKPPKKSYIDFDKEFKLIIEIITGIEIKYASYSQTVEMEKVKTKVKEKIEAREEMSYFISKEEEVRFLEKTIIQEVELNKRLPIIKNKNNKKPKVISNETNKQKNIVEEKEKIIEKEINDEIKTPPIEQVIEIEEITKADIIFNDNSINNNEKEIEEDIILKEENVTDNQEIILPINIKNIEEETINETIIEEIEQINNILINPLTSEEEYDDVKEKLSKISEEIDSIIVNKELNDITKEKYIKLKEEIDIQENKIPEKKEHEEKEEQKLLDDKLKEKEIRQLNNLMQTIYEDNKLDKQEQLINDIEDLNNMSLQEIKRIEKKLLKKRLKKAAKAIEPPLLLSLPFVRNKFFFGFTAGLFLHNHLNTIDSLYNRKNVEYTPLDEKKYITGKKAMEDAVSLNQNNFQRVENIKEKYLIRYPELSKDPDFVLPIITMETKLQKQEERLIKTSTRFDHTKQRQNYIYKKLTLPKKDKIN